MYKNAVLYKGVWLAPGSTAMELYEAKKFIELDQHRERVAQAAKDLLKKYATT